MADAELQGQHDIVSPEQRRHGILAHTRATGQVSVADLAESMAVSLETVRRDLTVLEAHGLIRRSYGVAYPVETAAYESDLTRRGVEHAEEKKRIADEAVKHLGDAETLFIDEGFTPEVIARALPRERSLKVVTASLPIASVLAGRDDVTVYLLGGRVRGHTLGTVDHWVTDMLNGFVIDLAFIGANAISREHGLTTPDPAVAEVKATAVRVSRRKIFIGVSQKFAVSSFCRFAGITDFEMIISDRRLSSTEAQRIAALGPTVTRV